jgi:hypothetical protein
VIERERERLNDSVSGYENNFEKEITREIDEKRDKGKH